MTENLAQDTKYIVNTIRSFDNSKIRILAGKIIDHTKQQLVANPWISDQTQDALADNIQKIKTQKEEFINLEYLNIHLGINKPKLEKFSKNYIEPSK